MFREERMGSVFTCKFLTVYVLNTLDLQYFCVSSSFGNLCNDRGKEEHK